ncbi:MAG: MarR family transcriptional regulator [Promethearchaeota archaeon]|nr:MAG: MarR family transcriptional regulator [Candidatus Lokiarchaeota archaeon]
MANEALISILDNMTDPLTPIQLRLIEFLKINGSRTRRELVNQLKIPRTTLYDNLLKLQKQRIVEKYAKNNGKRGRPVVYWKIINVSLQI